ncbi:MAG: serine/threonine protein kinase [Planctomycetes bacterium]|nr:serine/threonine protein kinase [Planctomycetota bacterium]
MEPVSENTPLDRFPGKTLDGFLIETPLGRGGMAAVFRARDIALNRPVALKVLRSQAVRDGATRERFLEEARAAAKLHHPNVIETHRAGESAGVLYMAMQYVNGRTLEKLLKNDGRMPWRRALAVGREVARALEAAHAAGMAHRDIKPANIMVGPDGHVTVMDFGVAKPLAGEVMDSREFAGTPVYASPEQHSTGTVDGRTDLWSLGVTIYQMLTGRIPFVAEEPAELRRLIATEEPIAIRDLEPSVPKPVADLVEKLMSKRPGDRPATASDTIRALDAALRKAALKWPVVAAAAVLLLAGGAFASQKIRAWRPAELNPGQPGIVRGTAASNPAPAPVDSNPARPPVPSAPWTARPILMIAELSGPEGDWLRTAVPDLVARDIAAAGRVVVLPKSRACADIALAHDVEVAAESAGRTHGAEAVLFGEVRINGERVQVRAVLLRLKPGSGVQREEFTANGNRREVNVLAAGLAEKVRKVLEAPPKKEEGS